MPGGSKEQQGGQEDEGRQPGAPSPGTIGYRSQRRVGLFLREMGSHGAGGGGSRGLLQAEEQHGLICVASGHTALVLGKDTVVGGGDKEGSQEVTAIPCDHPDQGAAPWAVGGQWKDAQGDRIC